MTDYWQQLKSGQYSKSNPPDVDEVKEKYAEGEISDEALDELLDRAMEAYPPDGKSDRPEFGLLEEQPSIHPTQIVASLLLMFFVGVLIVIFVADLIFWLF